MQICCILGLDLFRSFVALFIVVLCGVTDHVGGKGHHFGFDVSACVGYIGANGTTQQPLLLPLYSYFFTFLCCPLLVYEYSLMGEFTIASYKVQTGYSHLPEYGSIM